MRKKRIKRDKRLKYKAALVMLASLGFSYLLWYSYYIHIDNVVDEDLPLIKAPSNIISKPQNRGGIIIPNKDKDIYNRMSGKRRGGDKIKVIRLTENNLSKSEAIALINKQLKNGKIKRKENHKGNANNGSFLSKLFAKSYYLRIAKLTNPKVMNKALKILQNKYPDLKSFDGKLYKEQGSDGKTKYYLHIGPVKGKKFAGNLCAKLISAGKACKVVTKK
ncbi:MAG: hypothetical protein HRU36_00540 [Rickettsiales bacterium]|nr:hypothetical protein [Rickettsiales bacterium]